MLQKEVDYKLKKGDQEALNTVSYFITKHMQENERISAELLTNTFLQQALSIENETNMRVVNKTLRDALVGRDGIRSIHIITSKGNVISEFKEPSYLKNTADFLEQLDLSLIEQKKGSVYWGIGTNVLEPEVGSTLYLARMIRSRDKLESLGYLIIYIDPREFEKTCRDMLDNIDLKVRIKDSLDQTFQIPRDIELNNIEEIVRWEDKEYNYIKRGSKKYYYVIQDMPILNGKIMGINSHARANTNMNTIFLFAVTVNIIFLSGASLLIKRKVILPLKHIADKARMVGKQGNLDTHFTIATSYTEVYEITYALDEMMQEIKELVSEVKEKEKMQKRLELSIINHQVKPHFLYNTLNTASIMVALEEKEAADELIKTLAKYYRACLGTGDDVITIQEELQIVKEYVKIAVIRNPNIIHITYDVEEEALEHKILKITLQSLVENSIKYGIKKIGQPVNVHLAIKLNKEQKMMFITIEDDGIGISEEMIQKIKTGEKLEVKSGFGLKAIITRILLYYDLKDTNEVIEIDSRCGEYTKILLKIPY
ncbi:MAG: histidine kinase [Candidatus Cellulosilyticum pullistercoris]|uniref:Histidine kinase n=1 Tax=Candidatus Cellulosilyticum pullistercoris TaxID=2838521 RepID=A0A9E2KDC4_9FIRM|nr:histidine kinase [Candidatus Cellulosilyticum pullistercoris]